MSVKTIRNGSVVKKISPGDLGGQNLGGMASKPKPRRHGGKGFPRRGGNKAPMRKVEDAVFAPFG